MGDSSGAIITCSGIIENPGGFGSYTINQDVTQTICSGNGQCIQLTFTEFGTEACCDQLTVYDGTSNFDNILNEYAGATNPGVVTCSGGAGGCITLNFQSDGSINSSGFRANISCVSCPASIILGQGGDSISTCSGLLLDPSGSSNYENNLNVTQTFCASDSGLCLTLSFLSFNTELDNDVLSIYDGLNSNSDLIGQFSGTVIPNAITSSSDSGGCLTLSFVTNGSVSYAGFKANLSCDNCSLPYIVLGQNENTIYTCGATVLDPGGFGSYGNNQDYTQTICSEIPGQCISLVFNDFALETTLDRLFIYDGPNTSAELINVLSGIGIPAPVSSSNNSSGCLTLVFTSNGSVTNSGFSATISCGICQEPILIPTGFCEDFIPFCSNIVGGITYSPSIGINSEFGSPGNVGCLGSTPNPAWFFFQIQDNGPIDIQISSGFDVDFICWGPFNQTQWNEGVCSLVFDTDWSNQHIADCSYSASSLEYCNITNTQTGEYYLMLISNYANQPSITTIYQIGGIGTTNCNSLCDHSISTFITDCDSTNNTYSINSTLYLPHPPVTGTLSIINSSGGMLTFEAPFPDTLNFSFTHLASDGLQHQIQLGFSGDPFCSNTVNYTAPLACNTCSVSASLGDTIVCSSFPIHLLASEISGGIYSWTGPNGFTSSEHNPVIANAELNMTGVYQLDVFNPLDSCHSLALVNVIVNQFPEEVNITGNMPVCAGDTLILDVTQYSDAEYTWYKSGIPFSNDSSLEFLPTTDQDVGIYTCSIDLNGCVNSSVEEELTIYPTPSIPTLFFDPLSNSLHAFQATGNYQWYFGSDLIEGQTFDTLKLVFPGYYNVVVTNEFGCSNSSIFYFYNPVGIQELSNSILTLQPNPAEDFIHVFVPETGVLEVRDIAGKFIQENKLQKGTNSISVIDLADGLYLFQFKSNDGIRFTKVIIEHN